MAARTASINHSAGHRLLLGADPPNSGKKTGQQPRSPSISPSMCVHRSIVNVAGQECAENKFSINSVSLGHRSGPGSGRRHFDHMRAPGAAVISGRPRFDKRATLSKQVISRPNKRSRRREVGGGIQVIRTLEHSFVDHRSDDSNIIWIQSKKGATCSSRASQETDAEEPRCSSIAHAGGQGTARVEEQARPGSPGSIPPAGHILRSS